jgi:hypothetical protein
MGIKESRCMRNSDNKHKHQETTISTKKICIKTFCVTLRRCCIFCKRQLTSLILISCSRQQKVKAALHGCTRWILPELRSINFLKVICDLRECSIISESVEKIDLKKLSPLITLHTDEFLTFPVPFP